MSDAISRSAVIDRIAEFLGPKGLDEWEVMVAIREIIENVPAIDAVPVVHARWIYSGDMDLDGNSQGYCSRCGAGDKHRADLKNFVPYCWKCGARMDEKEDTNGHQNY